MPLQPRISKNNLQLRIANRQKPIPPPDNEDGSFNLDGFKYKPGEYDNFTSWFPFAICMTGRICWKGQVKNQRCWVK